MSYLLPNFLKILRKKVIIPNFRRRYMEKMCSHVLFVSATFLPILGPICQKIYMLMCFNLDPEILILELCPRNIFCSVQSLSRVQFFAAPWIAARQASLCITNSRSSPRLMCIESVMPSSHLIPGRPLLLLPPIRPSISLFQRVNSSYQVAKVLEFQLQHQSFQWTPRTDLL